MSGIPETLDHAWLTTDPAPSRHFHGADFGGPRYGEPRVWWWREPPALPGAARYAVDHAMPATAALLAALWEDEHQARRGHPVMPRGGINPGCAADLRYGPFPPDPLPLLLDWAEGIGPVAEWAQAQSAALAVRDAAAATSDTTNKARRAVREAFSAADALRPAAEAQWALVRAQIGPWTASVDLLTDREPAGAPRLPRQPITIT